MPGKYLLAVDVGTGSGRCLVFDLDGRQIAVAQQEWLPKLDPRYPGAQDFDTDTAWLVLSKAISQSIERAGIDPREVAAVTATSLREGMVLYDAAGQVIWACPNADARAHAEVRAMVGSGLAQQIYQIGGDWPAIISPPRFWWIREHQPEVYARIAHMTMLSDWVLYQLAGKHVTEPSVGSSSGMFDLTRRSWSDRIIELADLPRGIYPQVVECGTVIGEVTPAAARATGLAPGTPVVAGGADTQLALLGAAMVRPNMYGIVGGTFWLTAMVLGQPLIDPQFRLRTLCHVVPGQWMTEGVGFFHGFTMRWFRDGFCQEEKRLAAEQGVDAYELMERLAAMAPPGSGGVYAMFSNIMDAKRWRHTPPSLVGFDVLAPERSGKKECIRAIEENAAYVARGHFEILTEMTGRAPDEVIFSGGSAKGVLWPQIVADVLGVPVRIPVVKETASLGAAISAGRGIGVYGSWDEAVERVVRWERLVEPQPEHHAQYDSHFERWKQAYGVMLSLTDDCILPALWRAPGV